MGACDWLRFDRPQHPEHSGKFTCR